MKKFIKTTWSDIKEFKNLELYLVLGAIIGIFSADILGIETVSVLIEIVLATLAVLIYGMIDERHTNSELREKLDTLTERLAEEFGKGGKTSKVFLKEKPDYNEIFSSASEIYLAGYSLSRTVRDNYHVFSQRLQSGTNIKVIVLDPENDPLLEMASKESLAGPKDTWRNTIIRTSDTIGNLFDLHKNSTGTISLGYLPYSPSFGLKIVDPKNAHGVCFVEIYHHKSMAPNATFKLSSEDDGYWFDFFIKQFDKLWETCRIEDFVELNLPKDS